MLYVLLNLQSGDDPGKCRRDGNANEFKNAPVYIAAVVGGACVAITKAVDNVEKEQALMSKDQDLLRKDIEISHLKSKLELNKSFTSMGYGAEYIK